MRHKWLVLLLLGVMGAASVAGVWRAAYPPVAPFLAPCAFDAQIADAGKERREVAYQVAESSANWRAVVGQQLMERGWTPSDPGVFEAPRAIYLCITSFGVGNVVERAELDGGAREARITVIRWLYWAWPQLIDWR